jgi:hypothetical protein
MCTSLGILVAIQSGVARPWLRAEQRFLPSSSRVCAVQVPGPPLLWSQTQASRGEGPGLHGIYRKPILSFWDFYLRRNFAGRTPIFARTLWGGPIHSQHWLRKHCLGKLAPYGSESRTPRNRKLSNPCSAGTCGCF